MAEDLRIQLDGAVTAQHDAARELLRRSNGPWQLLPVAPELMLLARDSRTGLWPLLAALRSEQAVLAGDLSQMQPCDLLNFLHQGARTGVLLARSGDSERGIALLDGNVAWACSTSPGERLGELMIRGGVVERGVVDAALAEQFLLRKGPDAPQVRLGALIAELGKLTPEAMARALRHQVIEIFLGLLVLKTGTFLFLRGCDEEKLPARLALDTEALLLDGLGRLDEMELFRGALPSLSVKLVCTPAPLTGDAARALSPEARALHALIDGGRTLGQAASLAALGEYEATKAAFRLLEAGFVAVPAGKA